MSGACLPSCLIWHQQNSWPMVLHKELGFDLPLANLFKSSVFLLRISHAHNAPWKKQNARFSLQNTDSIWNSIQIPNEMLKTSLFHKYGLDRVKRCLWLLRGNGASSSFVLDAQVNKYVFVFIIQGYSQISQRKYAADHWSLSFWTHLKLFLWFLHSKVSP